jgi:hypothetical protein
MPGSAYMCPEGAALYSADEHAKPVCPNMATATALGPPGAETGPNREPGRILSAPATEQPGIRRLRISLPAQQWRLRDACGLSRLNDLLALWSQAHMPSCNGQVTSTPVHMAKPGSASAPRAHAPQ